MISMLKFGLPIGLLRGLHRVADSTTRTDYRGHCGGHCAPGPHHSGLCPVQGLCQIQRHAPVNPR